MIAAALQLLGGLLILAGGLFFLVGAIGIHRMPDVFTRLHAASLSDTTGVALVLLGLMLFSGWSLVTVKLVFLLLFLLFMGPVATHALAAAALHAGNRPDDGTAPLASRKPAASRRKGRR